MSEESGLCSPTLSFVFAAAASAPSLRNFVAFAVMAIKNGGAAFTSLASIVEFTMGVFCVHRWKMLGLSSGLAMGVEKLERVLSIKHIILSRGSIIPLLLLAVFNSTVTQTYAENSP